jgi:hypothetical protein
VVVEEKKIVKEDLFENVEDVKTTTFASSYA